MGSNILDYIKKSINIPYLKENLKTSKAIILLILLGIPILNLLINLSITSNDYIYLSEINALYVLNYIGLCIVPFLLSACLLGVVFSKKKVDLIVSMPLNKRSVFLSNSIGGIIIIILLQLLLMISTAIPIFINVEGLNFLGSLLIGSFFRMTIAYCFMFALCNLAITFTGKIQSHIVLIIIMAVLFPIGLWEFQGAFTRDYLIDNIELTSIRTSNILPEPLAKIQNFYDSSSTFGKNVYTIIITILVIALGTFLFTNKKLENSEESFKNNLVHEFVKGLTIILLLGNYFSELVENFEFTISLFIVLTILVVYYFLYDLIMGKKIALSLSIKGIAITIACSTLLGGILVLGNDFHDIEINKDYTDIKEVGIEITNIERTYISHYSLYDGYSSKTSYMNYGTTDLSDYYFTKDRDTIDCIYDLLKNGKDNIKSKNTTSTNYNYNYNNSSVNSRNSEDDYIYQMNVAVKLKNGKYGCSKIYLKNSDVEKLAGLLENTDCRKFLQERINPKDAVYTGAGGSLYYSKKSEKRLNKNEYTNKIKKLLSNAPMREIFAVLGDVRYSDFSTYTSSSEIPKITNGYTSHYSSDYINIYVYRNAKLYEYKVYTDNSEYTK